MIAVHEGGPADGKQVTTTVDTDATAPVRFYCPAATRRDKTVRWVELARYVFVPPQDGQMRRYRYSGIHHTSAPALGGKAHPDWS